MGRRSDGQLSLLFRIPRHHHVCGRIFVLITLIMAIELAQTVANAGGATKSGVSTELLNSLASLNETVEQMQREVDSLSAEQSAAAGMNRFNREETLKLTQTRLEQLQQRNARIDQDLEDTKRALTDAEQIEAELLAQNRAAEAEREEMKRLQDKRREIERYSAVLEIDRPMIFRDQTTEGRYVVLVKLEANEIWLPIRLMQGLRHSLATRAKRSSSDG